MAFCYGSPSCLKQWRDGRLEKWEGGGRIRRRILTEVEGVGFRKVRWSKASTRYERWGSWTIWNHCASQAGVPWPAKEKLQKRRSWRKMAQDEGGSSRERTQAAGSVEFLSRSDLPKPPTSSGEAKAYFSLVKPICLIVLIPFFFFSVKQSVILDTVGDYQEFVLFRCYSISDKYQMKMTFLFFLIRLSQALWKCFLLAQVISENPLFHRGWC